MDENMTTRKCIEKANTVFFKLDSGIYYVYKDRNGTFYGKEWVGVTEVINKLQDTEVLVLDKNMSGSVIIKNF